MNRDHPTLAKVRKLLAKAEDPSVTPAEAELYTMKAAELIAEYGIDQALLEHDDGDRAAVGSRIIVLDRPFAADKADLLCTVAIRMRCACVRRTERPRRAEGAFRARVRARLRPRPHGDAVHQPPGAVGHRTRPGARTGNGAQGRVPALVDGGVPASHQ